MHRFNLIETKLKKEKVPLDFGLRIFSSLKEKQVVINNYLNNFRMLTMNLFLLKCFLIYFQIQSS